MVLTIYNISKYIFSSLFRPKYKLYFTFFTFSQKEGEKKKNAQKNKTKNKKKRRKEQDKV